MDFPSWLGLSYGEATKSARFPYFMPRNKPLSTCPRRGRFAPPAASTATSVNDQAGPQVFVWMTSLSPRIHSANSHPPKSTTKLPTHPPISAVGLHTHAVGSMIVY